MSERDLLALWGLYVARLQELLQAGAAAQQPTQQQQIMLRVNALQREATLLAIRPAFHPMYLTRLLVLRIPDALLAYLESCTSI